jgi:hypothetical protein
LWSSSPRFCGKVLLSSNRKTPREAPEIIPVIITILNDHLINWASLFIMLEYYSYFFTANLDFRDKDGS